MYQACLMRSVGLMEHDPDGKPVRIRGIMKDVNNRIILSQSMKKSENRYYVLFENAGDAILIADMNGHLEEINLAGELLLGYSRDEICQMNIVTILPVDELTKIRQYIEEIATHGRIMPIETKILRKDDQSVDVEIRPALIDIGGRKFVQGIFIDRTECKRLENDHLAAEKSKRDALIREVHHRIKNNLQGVIGILHQFSASHPEVAEPLNQAISQMQSVAVIHGLQGRASLAKVRACELTVAIAAGVESLWQKPIIVDIPNCWKPCTITETEAVPLALILNELILNAVKHGEADDPVRIMLSHEPRNDSIRLTIHNIGLIPVGFGREGTTGFGIGLQLVVSLLPQTGAKLSWAQQEHTVVTTLDLDAPIIHLESVTLNSHER